MALRTRSSVTPKRSARSQTSVQPFVRGGLQSVQGKELLDFPLVGPVLMLFLYIAGRPAVIEAVGHTMTDLVAQGGELVCYSLEFPRVQRDRTPVKRWNEIEKDLAKGMVYQSTSIPWSTA